MQTYLTLDARKFKDCDAARWAISNIVWGRKVLAEPEAYCMPNGKLSTAVATDVIDQAEDELIGYLLIGGSTLGVIRALEEEADDLRYEREQDALEFRVDSQQNR